MPARPRSLSRTRSTYSGGGGGASSSGLLLLEDPSVVPRNRAARYVAPVVETSVEDSLINSRINLDYWSRAATDEQQTTTVLWENSASNVFVFQSPVKASAVAQAPSPQERPIYDLIADDLTVIVHNPPAIVPAQVSVSPHSPWRSINSNRSSHDSFALSQARSRSATLPLLSQRSLSALESIAYTLREVPAAWWGTTPGAAAGIPLLSAVTIVVAEFCRYDRDFDLSEPLLACFVNEATGLVAGDAFELLSDSTFDTWIDCVILALRHHKRARRSAQQLSSAAARSSAGLATSGDESLRCAVQLPAVAAVLPLLDLTLPEIATRVRSAFSRKALRAPDRCHAYAADTLIALLELRHVVSGLWDAYCTPTAGSPARRRGGPAVDKWGGSYATGAATTTGTAAVVALLMRFVDVERFVRERVKLLVPVAPSVVSECLGASTSLDGYGALQFWDFQLFLALLTVGADGIVAGIADVPSTATYGSRLKRILPRLLPSSR
jgi:hypothetical protein